MIIKFYLRGITCSIIRATHAKVILKDRKNVNDSRIITTPRKSLTYRKFHDLKHGKYCKIDINYREDTPWSMNEWYLSLLGHFLIHLLWMHLLIHQVQLQLHKWLKLVWWKCLKGEIKLIKNTTWIITQAGNKRHFSKRLVVTEKWEFFGQSFQKRFFALQRSKDSLQQQFLSVKWSWPYIQQIFFSWHMPMTM